MLKKKLRPRIKARIRKNKQILNKKIENLFDWVKGAELVELKECNTNEDPVRPELDNVFRRSYGRKIYGVRYMGEIHAVMCFAYTNQIPRNVEELGKFSHDAYLKSAQRDNIGHTAHFGGAVSGLLSTIAFVPSVVVDAGFTLALLMGTLVVAALVLKRFG